MVRDSWPNEITQYNSMGFGYSGLGVHMNGRRWMDRKRMDDSLKINLEVTKNMILSPKKSKFVSLESEQGTSG